MKYLTEVLFILVIGVSVDKIFTGFNESGWGTHVLIVILAVDALNWTRFKRHLREQSPEAAKTMTRILDE